MFISCTQLCNLILRLNMSITKLPNSISTSSSACDDVALFINTFKQTVSQSEREGGRGQTAQHFRAFKCHSICKQRASSTSRSPPPTPPTFIYLSLESASAHICAHCLLPTTGQPHPVPLHASLKLKSHPCDPCRLATTVDGRLAGNT